ncbi:MAG: DNA repair protein RadC [Anaerovoracaceae bacterium]
MKINEMAMVERPREKMIKYGSEILSNSELLAIILKTGTRKKSVMDLADEVLNYGTDGLRSLMEMSFEELMQINGVGLAKATEILATIELGKRFSTSKVLDRGRIESVNDVVNLYMEEMRYFKKEYFRAILLDSKGKIISTVNVSVGDLSSSVVHPRETFVIAIKRSAASIILLHNHPSGNPEPSEADISVTKRLAESGELLGIKILDHIIIGDGTFFSMKSKGII